MKFFYSILLLCFISTNVNASENIVNKVRSGGDLTVYNTSRDAFAKPAPNLSASEFRKFTFGNKVFNTNWTTAPSSVASLDGLGPLFNRNSCSGCHTRDGRGRPPLNNSETLAKQSILFRLSILDKNGKVVPHPVYGDQLNSQGINGVKGEGLVEINYEKVKGKFADGEKYELRRPIYQFKNLNYGELGDNFMFSPRVAQAVMGLGLLEAVLEETILEYSDENDKNNDGISGRANYVFDKESKKDKIGRFGWKANQPTLKQQDAGAALGDMGITTSINPHQNCGKGQEKCKKQISGGNPELSNYQLEMLNFYLTTLAVPARRDVEKPEIVAGEEIFNKIGCAACHRPQIKTGKHKIKVVSYQIIHPYTDLLLHDMGDDLADNRPDILANGNEWRTPPLWGIGLVKTVNKHTFFLHDGRARNLEEAVLWHGGEAKKSQENYKKLPREGRNNLIEFLESL